MNKPLKLNLGCGPVYLEGYCNCDISDKVKKDKTVDLNGKLPFPDDSVDEILISHVLEHLSNIELFMSELHRILKADGVIVGAVPWAYCHGDIHWQHKTHWNCDTIRMVAKEFGFKVVEVKPISHCSSWKYIPRNMIPVGIRLLLDGLLKNMFDAVDFKLTK